MVSHRNCYRNKIVIFIEPISKTEKYPRYLLFKIINGSTTKMDQFNDKTDLRRNPVHRVSPFK